MVLESVAAGPPPPGIGRSERTDHGGQTTGSGGWASVGTGRLPETRKQLVKPGVLRDTDTAAPREGPCRPLAEFGLYTNGEKMKTF